MSPDGGLAGEHVGAVIESEICAERLKDNPLRLESMDLAVRTSQPRKFHGMGTRYAFQPQQQRRPDESMLEEL